MMVLPDGKLAAYYQYDKALQVWNVYSRNDTPVIEYYKKERCGLSEPFGVLSNGLLLVIYTSQNDTSIKIFDTMNSGFGKDRLQMWNPG